MINHDAQTKYATSKIRIEIPREMDWVGACPLWCGQPWLWVGMLLRISVLSVFKGFIWFTHSTYLDIWVCVRQYFKQYLQSLADFEVAVQCLVKAQYIELNLSPSVLLSNNGTLFFRTFSVNDNLPSRTQLSK